MRITLEGMQEFGIADDDLICIQLCIWKTKFFQLLSQVVFIIAITAIGRKRLCNMEK
jgi:hypothetical protein